MNYRVPIILIVSLTFLSCTETHQPNNDRSYQSEQHQSSPVAPNPSEIIPATTDSLSTHQEPTHQTTSHTTTISIEPDYFQRGYDDGYQDGASLEKGRSYDNSLKGEDARDYRRGYFAGYPDGRADNDPDDEYVTGKNNADYYDTRDDDDWSEDGDFDDDDDGW